VEPRRSILLVTALVLLGPLGFSPSSHATMVARWQLIEAGPPYADTSGNFIPLYWYSTTAAPGTGTSFEGTAAQLISVSSPGISTRLTASSSRLQNDSFGFSFWVNPVNLTAGQNLLAKEMPYNNTVPNSSRMAWQVQVGAPGYVRFTVLGNDPTQGSFGTVISSGVLPMHASSELWYHVAGGYNAQTGQLSIFVNGYENDSLNSLPGAHSSDGSPLDIGTVMNGTDVVASAAAVYIQDVQIFDQPLSASNVAFLWDNPGQALAASFVPKRPLNLLAHWKMIDSNPPYSDFSGNGIPLIFDSATTPPASVPGLPGIGSAAQLQWQNSPGVGTRLTTSSSFLQSDNFGFSFWISPNFLKPLDNLIAKEMPYNSTVSTRLAWQVQVGPDDSTGNAPLLFTVLGNNPAQRFYGNATSSVTVPLYVNQAGGWIHVAGGYDSTTGALALFVNGVQSDSTNSAAGAHSSDGSPFDIGTVRNGPDFVSFAAMTEIDDVQIYDDLLSAYEVNYLIANPGQVATNFLAATNLIFFPTSGNTRITFHSYGGCSYFAEASTDLVTYVTVGNPNVAANSSATIQITKANLDAAFGTGPRPQVLFRIHAVVPDGASVFNPCN